MSIINYRRHFTLLFLAAVVLPVLVDPVAAVLPVVRLHAYLGLVGLLNATTWVLALRIASSLKRRIAFLLLATALSIGAPYVALVSAIVLPSPSDDLAYFYMFGTASAGGALMYWLAVRAFWLRGLHPSSLMITVAICVVATLASLMAGAVASGYGSRRDPLYFDLPTSFWWLAFSGSMLLAEGGWLTTRWSRRRRATGPASGIGPPRLIWDVRRTDEATSPRPHA